MQIAILDDHTLFSEGLSKIIKAKIENAVIHSFDKISRLQHEISLHKKIDLLISDIEIPGEDTFTFFDDFKLRFKQIPLLVVSMHNKLSVIRKCKEMGIEGYLLKDDYDLVYDAINNLRNGEDYYSPKVLKTLEILNKKESLLTPKEEEIIALLAAGLNNQEIAEKLFISYHTIKTHRKNINRKLNVNTTAELVKYYYENYVL